MPRTQKVPVEVQAVYALRSGLRIGLMFIRPSDWDFEAWYQSRRLALRVLKIDVEVVSHWTTVEIDFDSQQTPS